MAEGFDPYHRWLGIPAHEQPPHHYRLLGLNLFEAHPDVIENAADQRMIHLRSFQAGKNGPLSQKLLNEIAAAKVCLLDPEKKAAYDAALRQRQAAAVSAPPVPTAVQQPAPVQPSTPAIRVRARPQRKKQFSPLVIAAIVGLVLAVCSVVGVIVVLRMDEPTATASNRTTAGAAHAPHATTETTPISPKATLPAGGSTASAKTQDNVDAAAAADSGKKAKGKAKPKSPAADAADDDDYSPPPRKTLPPLAAATGQTLDLLPLIDARQAKVKGDWLFAGRDLLVRAGKEALLQIPFAPPEEYDLELAIKRGNPPANGAGAVIVGLVVNGAQVQVGFDFTSGARAVSGVSLIEDHQPWRNETRHSGMVLPPGETVSLVVRVRRSRVQVVRGSETIVDWEPDLKRYRVAAESLPPNPRQLALFSKAPNVRFSRVAIQAVDPKTELAADLNNTAQPPREGTAKGLAPEPNATEQAKARQDLIAVVGQPGKKSAAEKTQTAIELFDRAKAAAAGSVERYAALREAQRWATEALNARLAIDAIEMLRNEFAINQTLEVPKAITSLGGVAKEDGRAVDSILEAALPLAERLFAEKQLDAAQKTLDALGRLAQRTKAQKYGLAVAELKIKVSAVAKGRRAKASGEAEAAKPNRILLVMKNKEEKPLTRQACERFGLVADEADSFDRQRTDYSQYTTIMCGSNDMDYWGKPETKTPEAFQHLAQFVSQGGHLVVMGTFNGRNCGHLAQFGIHTGVMQSGTMESAGKATDLFFEGVPDLLPKDGKMQCAGSFQCSRQHDVLIQVGPGQRQGEPAVATLPFKAGRVTYSSCEPMWKNDLWLLTATLSWIARGAPVPGG